MTDGSDPRGRELSSEEDETREKSAHSREEAVSARERRVADGEASATVVRQELQVIMDALREANEHLVVANVRGQTLAEDVNRLYQDAITSNQAKDDFFALLSHELRTPLTSITGWAGLLKRSPDKETVAEAAQSIASSAALQAKLVDDLLDVSRIMNGKFAVTLSEIDLGKVVHDAVSAMRPTAVANGASLLMTAKESILIRGDAGRLSQVFSNLLSNAVKFTPAGGLIEVKMLREGTFAVVDVCDTGEGIPASFLPKVFERHAQAESKRYGGLGLGLAIVKHIVELHGGSVGVTSKGEGRGSTFTIRIPVRSTAGEG